MTSGVICSIFAAEPANDPRGGLQAEVMCRSEAERSLKRIKQTDG